MRVGIIGAAGFAGFELVKILSNHPKIELVALNSKTFAGTKVKSVYPEFWDENLAFTNYSAGELNSLDLDVVFLAVPHGASMGIAPKLKCGIIDLGSDYRFPDAKLFKKVNGIEHADKKHLKEWVYGLPELFRPKIKKAKLVANPGCYATACILAGLPLAKEKLFSNAVFDCKSGYSGAGRAHASDKAYMQGLRENIVPYKLTSHRHMFEMRQFLGKSVSFTPHVLPFYRGIVATGHFFLKKKLSGGAVRKKFEKFYANEPFVKIVEGIPTMHDIQKSNYCLIGGFEVDDNNRLVIVSTLDNLVKGAAGQAVQNMNLMFGFDEKLGLEVLR